MEEEKVTVELPKTLFERLKNNADGLPVESIIIYALTEYSVSNFEKEREMQRLRLLDAFLEGLEAAAREQNKHPIDLAYQLFKK